jgi:hypothetical protein
MNRLTDARLEFLQLPCHQCIFLSHQGSVMQAGDPAQWMCKIFRYAAAIHGGCRTAPDTGCTMPTSRRCGRDCDGVGKGRPEGYPDR